MLYQSYQDPYSSTECCLVAYELDHTGKATRRIRYLPQDAPLQRGGHLATPHRPEERGWPEGKLSFLTFQPAPKGYADDEGDEVNTSETLPRAAPEAMHDPPSPDGPTGLSEIFGRFLRRYAAEGDASPATIRTYHAQAAQYVAWCQRFLEELLRLR